MTLRETIVHKITMNLPWAVVWIEIKGQYGAYWIMLGRDWLGV